MSTQFQLLDLRLGGQLTRYMIQTYAETGSWEQVARRLLIEHGTHVSGQTLRRWAERLELSEKAAS